MVGKGYVIEHRGGDPRVMEAMHDGATCSFEAGARAEMIAPRDQSEFPKGRGIGSHR